LIFNYPTTTAIADYLAREILAAEPSKVDDNTISAQPEPSETDTQAGAGLANMLDNLEELSDEEVSRLLAMKMKGKTNE